MRLFKPLWAIAVGCLLFCSSGAHAQAFAQAEGGKVAYETCGAGDKAIVLLHDGVLHGAAYDTVWPLLCQHYRVVRYDRRGYGATPPATAPFAAVDDLSAVMKAAGLEHATLVGSSSGGGIATDFALAHPEAVDGLVLAGPWISGFKPSKGFMARGLKLALLIKIGALKSAAKDPYILTKSAKAERARVVALLQASPQTMNNPSGKVERGGPNSKDRLGEIRAPTLLLVGAIDIKDVFSQAESATKAIPGARLEIVPDAGHFMYLERPEYFARRVAAFVEAR